MVPTRLSGPQHTIWTLRRSGFPQSTATRVVYSHRGRDRDDKRPRSPVVRINEAYGTIEEDEINEMDGSVS